MHHDSILRRIARRVPGHSIIKCQLIILYITPVTYLQLATKHPLKLVFTYPLLSTDQDVLSHAIFYSQANGKHTLFPV